VPKYGVEANLPRVSRLRIGFDVSPLHVPHPPGVVRATRGLVEALERRAILDVVRLVPEGNLRSWRQRDLPRSVARLELRGIHSPVSAFPLRGPGLRVQTIHELPWRHGVKENADWKHRAWAALGPVRADGVLCPSEHVARDLRARWLPGASRIRVAPWGVGAPFSDLPEPGSVDEVVLGKYRLGQDPIVLCVGAVREKKNLAGVLRGLAEVRKRNGPRIQLVVTGAPTPDLRRDLGLVSQLGLSRFVSTPGELPEHDLAALYRLASAVAVLSHSEGFAFPALEALASGTPAVVSRDSAQAELAGTAGVVVDPADAVSVADGLTRAVLERESLRFDALERATAFTWDACAQRVETLWQDLA
jgi:glycosyltransferase involved in cell wall biosynthesis